MLTGVWAVGLSCRFNCAHVYAEPLRGSRVSYSSLRGLARVSCASAQGPAGCVRRHPRRSARAQGRPGASRWLDLRPRGDLAVLREGVKLWHPRDETDRQTVMFKVALIAHFRLRTAALQRSCYSTRSRRSCPHRPHTCALCAVPRVAARAHLSTLRHAESRCSRNYVILGRTVLLA
jgi:hypothetical protein